LFTCFQSAEIHNFRSQSVAICKAGEWFILLTGFRMRAAQNTGGSTNLGNPRITFRQSGIVAGHLVLSFQMPHFSGESFHLSELVVRSERCRKPQPVSHDPAPSKTLSAARKSASIVQSQQPMSWA
jgi:hypothetical protein